MPKHNTTTYKRLTASVVIILLLSVCLAVTTFALVYSMVAVEGNLFHTATVRINLNGGQPVIRDDEFLFEPGMTVKKDFYLQNDSTCEVYYRLYFQNVDGGLADVLQVKICDGDKLLFAGSLAELTRANVTAADDSLQMGQRRDLQIYFHFPEDAGNAAQNQYLTFDLAAEAVQVKNNTDKSFE